MQSTEHFKNTIKAYLAQRAASDALFAITYAKTGKNIEDCITYILNTVHKSGCNGFTDDEVYSMAVHYYDEDNIEVGKNFDCRVVVNHVVELTAQEKEQARQDALQKAQEEAYLRMTQPPRKTQTTPTSNTYQSSLF
jgi:hypothetical protein